jgi:hypothetical protein
VDQRRLAVTSSSIETAPGRLTESSVMPELLGATHPADDLQ